MKIALPSFGLSPFLLLLLLAVASACNTSKFLEPEERLLQKNSIVLEIPKKQGNARNLKYELSTLEKQKPNTNFLLLFPREGFYFRNSQPKDSSRFRRFMKNKVGEKPAISDSTLAAATALDMQYYLNNKGYFDAKVNFKVKAIGQHKANVIYTASTHNTYTIDSVFFKSNDPKIKRILDQTEDETELRRGQPVSKQIFEKEVQRITKKLKNLGYFNFDRNFIDTLRGDSTDFKVDLYLEIFPPAGERSHRIFQVGNIAVYPNYYPGDEDKNLPDKVVDGIHFRSSEEDFNIKPQTISRSIFFKTGALYQEDNLEKTKLQLSRLNNFRAISVVPRIDSTQNDIIHFDIYLNPRKKLELGLDWEFNNSNYTQIGEDVSLLGTSVGANYRNWNLFRNATLLDHKINFGIDLNLKQLSSPDSLIYSDDFSYTISLFLPKFIPWIGPYKLLNRITVGKDAKTGEPIKFGSGFYQQLKEKAKTRISAKISRRNISTLYLENSYDASFGYELQTSPNHRFIINHTGFTFYDLPERKITPRYDSIRMQNEFLNLSQDKQLFTGILFRNFNYTYTSNINKFGESWYFNNLIELSGLEAWGANQLYNGLSGDTATFKILNNFQFEQYFKFELDLRYYHKYNENRSFVFRVNTGLARPYGFSDEVPYVKQFYLGGGNSMRAWRIRELGPGSFVEADSILQNSISYFQTGDFKLELNAEYRFKLVSNFDAALFIDVGNIWSLDSDDSRGIKSQFNLIPDVDPITNMTTEGFLNQMAVGAGFGIRWDFSYFILRFDAGIKLRNPHNCFGSTSPDGQDCNGKYWFPGLDVITLKDFNPNLAIGYPF